MAILRNRQDIGRDGEKSAEQFLCARGLRLVMRNYRCAAGEIDLVMQEGDTLVFVEVRRRQNTIFGSPLETVSAGKQRKLLAAAQHFVFTQNVSQRQAMRFDVVGIVGQGADEKIEWISNAF